MVDADLQGGQFRGHQVHFIEDMQDGFLGELQGAQQALSTAAICSGKRGMLRSMTWIRRSASSKLLQGRLEGLQEIFRESRMNPTVSVMSTSRSLGKRRRRLVGSGVAQRGGPRTGRWRGSGR